MNITCKNEEKVVWQVGSLLATRCNERYNDELHGNNRMVLNNSGGIVQAMNHYAFDSSFAENSGSDQYVQPYKYNGKKLDRILGLDYYGYWQNV